METHPLASLGFLKSPPPHVAFKLKEAAWLVKARPAHQYQQPARPSQRPCYAEAGSYRPPPGCRIIIHQYIKDTVLLEMRQIKK